MSPALSHRKDDPSQSEALHVRPSALVALKTAIHVLPRSPARLHSVPLSSSSSRRRIAGPQSAMRIEGFRRTRAIGPQSRASRPVLNAPIIPAFPRTRTAWIVTTRPGDDDPWRGRASTVEGPFLLRSRSQELAAENLCGQGEVEDPHPADSAALQPAVECLPISVELGRCGSPTPQPSQHRCVEDGVRRLHTCIQQGSCGSGPWCFGRLGGGCSQKQLMFRMGRALGSLLRGKNGLRTIAQLGQPDQTCAGGFTGLTMQLTIHDS